MVYDPYEHIPTRRHILATWLVCVGILATGLGAPTLWTLLHHRHEGNFAQHPPVTAPPHRA
jgi:hypothetical protein